MKINFVCRGNVWRSKVAEAYAKSLLRNSSHIEVSSSGIEATKSYDGPFSQYTKQILERDNLWQYAHPQWVQTTQAIIDKTDLLVFLNQDVFDDACHILDVPRQKSIIWNVPDKNDSYESIKILVKELIQQRIET